MQQTIPSKRWRVIMMGDMNYSLDINYIKNNIDKLKTPQVQSFVASQIGNRTELGHLTDEWWIDFFIGVSLWGIQAGTTQVK